MIKLKKIFCLNIIFFITFFTMGMNKFENKQIYKNITIQNINVGGMKYKEALDEINKLYKVKPFNIIYEDRIWTINPQDIELSYNEDKAIEKAYKYTNTDNNIENTKRKFKLYLKEGYNINLEATYNEVKLSNIIQNICKEIDIDKIEANFEIKGYGEIVRTPSKEGKVVDYINLKENIYSMIVNKNVADLDLPVNIIYPTITTEDVNSINTVLGQFSTSFSENGGRGINIHVAGNSTSNKLIMPGDIFSYNKSTGARNWVNGYKTAKVIVGGKYVDGEGGGACQVSTTIYNAALLGGIGIEEVHNHTLQSKYVPRGRDASVSYGYTDLKLKNTFSHPIYIYNIANNGCITSRIYGCSEDRQKLYIKTEESRQKESIVVKTYRIYLDEENNKTIEELIATSRYKIK